MEASIVKQIADQAETENISGIMRGILPKIAPLMKQAEGDFDDFLSGKTDGVEKTIIIRKFKDKPVLVMVFDNSKEWHVQSFKDKTKNVFKSVRDEILHMFTSMEFIQTLLSGGLKK